jgi:hypothetical protein
LGVAVPSWAATDPVNEGTRRVVTDRILAGLPDACGRSEATEGSRGSGVGHA